MNGENDFFNHYRRASSKLKKRFLKKPNVAEASNEFEQLKNHLSRVECFPYAGFTAVAKARCEQGLLNPYGEVESLVEAARFFLKADKEIDDMACPNFHEHLECAVACYNSAIRIYENCKMSAMAGSICLEMAEYYYKSCRYEQAKEHYLRSVVYHSEMPILSVVTLNKVLKCNLVCNDFTSALLASMKLVKVIKENGSYHPDGVTPLGHFHDMYKEVEVTRMLILLRLNPNPKSHSKDYGDIYKQYTWPDEDTLESNSNFLTKLLGEDLFIYLQSLVMACAAQDVQTLKTIQAEMRFYLTLEQDVLLQQIINEVSHPKALRL